MRLKKLIIGDIKFQIKYGFYFIYVILTILYVCLTSVLPVTWRGNGSTIMIFTDPAAMGMFFMGAIILLEKSQRVLDSLVVSPVKVWEYVASKIISLGIISTLVAIVIALTARSGSLFLVTLGTFFGSAMFTLLGIIVASRVSSLNQFILATIPLELICFLPPLLYLFGYDKSFMLVHPAVILIRFISGNSDHMLVLSLILIAWIALLYVIANKLTAKMFKSVGGVKL